MTVNELVKRADELVKSDIPLERRLEFISEAEGLVGCEILGLALADIPKYTEENADTELLAAPPHDKLYLPYLAAMLALYDGDTAAYENFTSLFNTAFAEYSRYISRRKDKTGRADLDGGIYLSAYAIAVKHGYRGSEEEWLSELDRAVKEAANAAEKAENTADSVANTADRLEKSLTACEANIKIASDNAEKSEIYAAESYKYSLSVKSLYESTLTSQKIAQAAEESAKASVENARTAQAIAQSAEASAKISVENARTAQAIAQAAEKTAKDAADEAKAAEISAKTSASDAVASSEGAKEAAAEAAQSAADAKVSENAINDRTATLENTVSELDGTVSELEGVIAALENRIAALEAAVSPTTAQSETAETPATAQSTSQSTEDEDE